MNPNRRSRADPEEVVSAVGRCLVQRRHVGGAFQHRRQRLPRVRAEVDDRLPGVEPVHGEQVDVRFVEVAGSGWPGNVDREHPIAGVRMVNDVERLSVVDGHDRRAVDNRRALDPDERTVPGSGHGTGLEPGRERESGRARNRDSRWAEIGNAAEVDHAGTEAVLGRSRILEFHGLDAFRATIADVCELGRIVDAQVVRKPGIRRVQQHIPDSSAVWPLAGIERQTHRVVAEIDLDGALQRQLVSRQRTTGLSEPGGRALMDATRGVSVLDSVLGGGGRGAESVPEQADEHDAGNGCQERGHDCDRRAPRRASRRGWSTHGSSLLRVAVEDQRRRAKYGAPLSAI